MLQFAKISSCRTSAQFRFQRKPPPMDQTTEEKTHKKILDVRKLIEKEIEEKKTILNELVLVNEDLEQERDMLEEWMCKYDGF